MRAVIAVVGRDTVGILAKMSANCASCGRYSSVINRIAAAVTFTLFTDTALMPTDASIRA